MDGIVERVCLVVFFTFSVCLVGMDAQELLYTESDTLRGTLTPERSWWDVHFYDLELEVLPQEHYLTGKVDIHFLAIKAGQRMQIDLRQPLRVDSVIFEGRILDIQRDRHLFYVDLPRVISQGRRAKLSIYYSGSPRKAPNPPWDGGFVWSSDEDGTPWIATSCQGLGASVWWPNKDHLSDEPDSMRISVTVPEHLVNISNGRLEEVKSLSGNREQYTWFVANPINNYNVTLNIGDYEVLRDTFHGAKGALPIAYWVLEGHTEQARDHFKGQVKPMLSCFEDWFGPYPYYEDGYKLVETPYLGMEHQSAIAYGNYYKNGYLGMDMSGTGWGRNWDYIIVHESGHEWWGNHVSIRDIADLWVHEGFTAYSEALYVECQNGANAGAEYIRGTRRRIANDRPIIGPYHVNKEGSGDMYFKGANLLHMIRRMIGYDARWREILLGIQREFGDQTTTSKAVEEYINQRTKVDLEAVFDQYLRQAELPVLEYRFVDASLKLRWRASVDSFAMPVELRAPGASYQRYELTDEWHILPWEGKEQRLEVHPDYYIFTERVSDSD